MTEFPEYESRLARPNCEKNPEFQSSGQLLHLVNGGQLKPDLLEQLFDAADTIRLLSRSKHTADALRQLLSHKRAMLYFNQPSTRTFLSFMAACQILGITCNEVRDPKTSSAVKRESHMDTIRMFSSYFDVIIMRSPLTQLAESCSYLMNDLRDQNRRWVPVINAGSGSDEHPTQALLDIYTLKRTFRFLDRQGTDQRFESLKATYPELVRGFEKKVYVFNGDIGRGRTVRSLATVLSQYDNVEMHFVSPDVASLRLDDALRQQLSNQSVPVFQHHSLDAIHDGKPLLSHADCLYMTRIQREHNSPDVATALDNLDLGAFRLTPERAARLKDYTPILHPFPRDSHVGEIPAEIDTDPRAMYFRQARNGMWVRAALLAHLFGAAHDLLQLADQADGYRALNHG